MEPTDGFSGIRPRGRLALSESEAALLGAVFDRMFPDDGDGHSASRMGAVDYVDGALAGVEAENLTVYRRLFDWLSTSAQTRWARAPVELADSQLDQLIAEPERAAIA